MKTKREMPLGKVAVDAGVLGQDFGSLKDVRLPQRLPRLEDILILLGLLVIFGLAFLTTQGCSWTSGGVC